MEHSENIRRLFARFLSRKCNEEELRQLFTYFGTADEGILRDLICREMETPVTGLEEADESRGDRLERIRKEIHGKLRHSPGVRSLYRRLLPYAAAVLVLALAGIGWYFLRSDKPAQVVLQSKYGNDVLPGTDRATLTLADGRRIDLDSARGGLIASQAGIAISKNKEGLVTYDLQGGDQETAETAYNTITTPKGGQYQIRLPDGSKVWLNAASSLTYPTYFTGAERRVMLKGEGYFEVTGNKEKPFVVTSAGQEVTVLGTKFNIHAYPDEALVRTTLVEGRVKVARLSSGNSSVLKPGWQSTVNGHDIRMAEVDVKACTGWKNGEFIFHNTDLSDIMLQLQRWYDIEIDLAGLPDEAFYGEINRNVRLSEVLDMIQSTSGVRFEIKNRRLIVKK